MTQTITTQFDLMNTARVSSPLTVKARLRDYVSREELASLYEMAEQLLEACEYFKSNGKWGEMHASNNLYESLMESIELVEKEKKRRYPRGFNLDGQAFY